MSNDRHMSTWKFEFGHQRLPLSSQSIEVEDVVTEGIRSTDRDDATLVLGLLLLLDAMLRLRQQLFSYSLGRKAFLPIETVAGGQKQGLHCAEHENTRVFLSQSTKCIVKEVRGEARSV